MKLKKITAVILAASVLSVSAGPIYALEGEDSASSIPESNSGSSTAVSQIQQAPYFRPVTGIVKEVHEAADATDIRRIILEDDQKEPVHFNISQDTYVINGEKLAPGVRVTGFVDANKPMILIYPPQYAPEVLYVEKEGLNVAVSIFDESLTNNDNTLKLNLSEDAAIVLKNGSLYTGKLEGKKLAVLYSISTRSIPAQTSPESVVVLDEEENQDTAEKKIEEKELLVNGVVVADAPSAYMQLVTTMIPLRAVVTALGYEIDWLPEEKEVRIGLGISLWPGIDRYHYMRMAPIYLETAPELINGTTFVPLQFFTEVMHMEKVEITKDQIIIQEKIHNYNGDTL